MKKPVILILLLLILYGCNSKKGNKTIEDSGDLDILAPPKLTILDKLPDSLQPEIISLDSMPKPISVIAGKGETKMLPFLQNEKGEPILESNGKPFIMGSGGKSNFTNFTTDNGLALDGINCSVMDKSGNLWFGTYGGGVSKYDGKSFISFTTAQGLANNNVSCITEDKSGNLWFGTNGGGVSKYDGRSFRNFTTAQGLVSNQVLSITEDKSGNLWFGTWGGGVSKYDGKIFSSFTTNQGLASNLVYCITEDKSGNLWFGTWGGGVSKYDGNSFNSFTTAQGLANNLVYCITEDKSGNLWLGTWGGGVSRYNLSAAHLSGSETFRNYTTADGLASNQVLCITEDKSGNLWFGTDGGGVSKYDGNSVDDLINGTNLYQHNQQDFKKNTKDIVKSFSSFTMSQGLSNNHISCITEDKSGNLWFGTYGGGLSKYDSKSFSSYTTTQGLANNLVYSIKEDRYGNLWFGTYGGGLSKYNGNGVDEIINGTNLYQHIQNDRVLNTNEHAKSFTTFSTVQGLSNNLVYSIMEDKSGKLWFGTWGGGVSKYDGITFTNYTIAQGLANNQILCITEDKFGNLWFGTDGGGVSKYNGNRIDDLIDGTNLYQHNQQEPGKNKNDLVRSFSNYTTAQGLANNHVNCITEDKSGNLWFGTNGGGVSKFDGKSFCTYTAAQGLASNNVNCIIEDKSGNLWFGTEEGLSVMRGMEVKKLSDKAERNDDNIGRNKTPHNLFTNFRMADGLADNFIAQIIQLPNGKMGVGTNLGISLFNLSDDYSKLEDLEIYNSNTGYPVKEVNVGHNCLYVDSKGIIWAATGSEKTALVRFDYAALYKNMEAPTVIIQSVKVNDENVCWYNLETKGIKKNKQDSSTYLLQEFLAYGKTLSKAENDFKLKKYGGIQFDSISKFYPLPQNLVLPYEYNQISFEFVAIETDRPTMVRYQYILEGYDKDWRPVTEKSHANFGNIHEGTYTFKVKGQGSNGVWSEPLIYTFKVLPPWYRSWWAYLIYVLLFLLALGIFTRWRERNLRREKEKLEHTVAVRTAEVVAEKKKSDDLLLNILPEEVAEELKAKGSADAKLIAEVTVLFTDFKGFTQLSEKLSPKELVGEINECFSAFDHIMQKHGVEKIKTIGDSYMAAAGLPTANNTHAEDIVNAALEIQQLMHDYRRQKEAEGKLFFEIRIGIHTGPVVAGIVGVKKFAYDIWGDTVNTASRMESSGEVGKVNISGKTYALVKDKFVCTHRGQISAKGKGLIDMYFVEGKIE